MVALRLRGGGFGGALRRMRIIEMQTEEELSAARKAETKTGWWAYMASLKEEVSSKQFYRMFKAKLSNSDFSSLFITPNWFEPELKAGDPTKWVKTSKPPKNGIAVSSSVLATGAIPE